MQASLRVNNLWKSYSAGVAGCSARVWALRGCALNLHAGERIAIGGRAGAGKSSLLHCIAGLRRPDAGTIDSSFARIILSAHMPPAIQPRLQRGESALYLVDDLAEAHDAPLHPLALMASDERASLIIVTRHLSRVAPLVHHVYMLREGRLSALPRSPVRRVAEPRAS